MVPLTVQWLQQKYSDEWMSSAILHETADMVTSMSNNVVNKYFYNPCPKTPVD